MVTSVHPTLGELAAPVSVWDAGTDIVRFEAALRDDPALPGLIAVSGDEVYVIDRPYLQSVLTGRLGFGRALLARRALDGLLPLPALVLSSELSWDDAARAALARPTGRKALPVAVRHPDGSLGIAPVGPLVDYLSHRYEAMALEDDLTGLGNRRLLADRAAQAFATPGATPVLMLIDLNRFKEINDALGHARGDELVQHVAAALRAACAPGTAFRLGGDEFVVLYEDAAALPPLERVARRLLDAIEGPYPIAGVPITVEAALGIAHTGLGHLDDLGKLLAAADAAMYTAKRDRTLVEVWSPARSIARTGDLAIQSELRDAIARRELVLHYQPLYDAHDRTIASLEALVRWEHPGRGLLSPGAFLPQAERSEIIHPMTEYLLAEAVRQAASWHRSGWTVPVAVNLAAPVLASDRIVEVIDQALRSAELPPEALIVEITESAVMTRPEEAAERLRAIRRLGVRIAMDDFGTGYTSLALLSQLPLDELKLDRAFVMRIHHQQEHVIVEAVTRMANGLGLTLVAEGVEDEATAQTLTAIGVGLLQGYHLSRPAPADVIRNHSLLMLHP
jgi:diguanylate cyclase